MGDPVRLPAHERRGGICCERSEQCSSLMAEQLVVCVAWATMGCTAVREGLKNSAAEAKIVVWKGTER